eukprot:scaffold19094_cov78-Phaeocystis_antarctica.AAC.1
MSCSTRAKTLASTFPWSHTSPSAAAAAAACTLPTPRAGSAPSPHSPCAQVGLAPAVAQLPLELRHQREHRVRLHQPGGAGAGAAGRGAGAPYTPRKVTTGLAAPDWRGRIRVGRRAYVDIKIVGELRLHRSPCPLHVHKG